MLCMRLRRYLMQNNFEPTQLKDAKFVLLKELQYAEQIHVRQKEHSEELKKSHSLLDKIKRFFRG